MGLSNLSEEELAAWVQQSCTAQRVPERITDPVTVSRVSALLGTEAGPGARATAEWEHAPDRT